MDNIHLVKLFPASLSIVLSALILLLPYRIFIKSMKNLERGSSNLWDKYLVLVTGITIFGVLTILVVYLGYLLF